LTSDAKS
jgi:hypothetical protein